MTSIKAPEGLQKGLHAVLYPAPQRLQIATRKMDRLVFAGLRAVMLHRKRVSQNATAKPVAWAMLASADGASIR